MATSINRTPYIASWFLLVVTPVILVIPFFYLEKMHLISVMSFIACLSGAYSALIRSGLSGASLHLKKTSIYSLLPGILGFTLSYFLLLLIVAFAQYSPLFGLLAVACYIPAIAGGYLSISALVKEPSEPATVNEVNLREFADSLFTSDEFLTTLRTTLPSGESDQLHGFDHIPFLLHNIDERRKRFSISASRFLQLTISLGFVFVIVLLLFGYILLNEDAVGKERNLSKLDATVESIDTNVAEYLALSEFIPNKVSEALEDVQEINWAKIDGVQNLGTETLNLQIVKFLETGKNSEELLNNIQSQLASLYQLPKTDSEQEKLEFAASSLNELQEKQSIILINLTRDMARSREVLDLVYEDIGKTESQVPELIKRLTIGLVIASFFLAIVRYVARIYNDHHQQEILAERDDLAIRQFYVSIRSAGENAEERALVLKEFIRGTKNSVAEMASGSTEDPLAKQNELVKEMINTLAKKL